MDNKEIYKKIEKLLYENGIIANAEDMGETIEMDSIMFVSLIVSIEETFDITVPVEMLLYEKWKSINLITENIENLVGKFGVM